MSPHPTPELERDVEAYFVRRVNYFGGMSVKLAPTRKGTPDRLALLGGRLYLVELKTPTGSLSRAQVKWHEDALNAGVIVHTVYGRKGVEDWFEKIWQQS